jgi:pimeloyl-ACP methyl ester carboxylesterase
MLLAGLAALVLTGCATTADRTDPASAAAVGSGASAFASHRMIVTVRGRGPDVLLIPGLASSAAVWDRTAERLDDTHRVHVVQVRGFAGTAAGANAQGPVFEPLVAELARYIQAQGLKRTAVIGHSMGGEAAMLLVARHPGLVDRVLIVDALPFFALLMNPAATAESARPMADAMRAGLLATDDATYRERQSAGLGALVNNPEARARHGAAAAASDKAVVATAMQELVATDLRPELGRLTRPPTVLYAYDPAWGMPASAADERWARAYSGVKDVRLVRIDGSRHFIMDDQPERFATEVDAFLRAP